MVFIYIEVTSIVLLIEYTKQSFTEFGFNRKFEYLLFNRYRTDFTAHNTEKTHLFEVTIFQCFVSSTI